MSIPRKFTIKNINRVCEVCADNVSDSANRAARKYYTPTGDFRNPDQVSKMPCNRLQNPRDIWKILPIVNRSDRKIILNTLI
jgi:hypothetical protein